MVFADKNVGFYNTLHFLAYVCNVMNYPPLGDSLQGQVVSSVWEIIIR